MVAKTQAPARPPLLETPMSASDFDQSPHHKKGVQLVREILGEPFAAAMQAAADSGGFAADCANIALESAFGAVWSRPGLDRKQRSLVTLGVLIGTGKQNELKNHVRAGLTNGLSVS